MIEVLKGRVCMYIFWDFGYVCGECHDNEVGGEWRDDGALSVVL